MNDGVLLDVGAFLDRIAERTPTPGGGSVTGVGGALACALARMVVAYSVTKRDIDEQARDRLEEVAASLRNADELLRCLVTQDIDAYRELTAAAKRKKDDPSTGNAYGAAVLAAMAVPMEMATVAGDILAVLDEAKALTSRYLLSDLGIAAVLAAATAQAARYTVRVNAGQLDPDVAQAKALSDIDAVVERCVASQASIEAYVAGGLKRSERPSR